MEERASRRARIADVAREAGVSKTAVSFAFNSPDRLSPETASRILDVADSLGYRPHPVARMLSQRQTLTIGVLVPQALSVIFSNPFFGAFSEGVALAAEELGYGLHFISPLHGSLASAMGRATVDGVVAIGLAADHPEVEQIRAAGVPLVMVDSSAMPDLPSIAVDDEGGARAAAEHLLGLGHRDFLVVGVEPPTTTARRGPEGVTAARLRGYVAALHARGVDLPDNGFVVGPASIEGGMAALRGALEDGLRPTAVLAMSDAMAIGALRAARELGLRVPADLSVVGFDDIEVAGYAGLTTVRQPLYESGRLGARVLLEALEGGGSPMPVRHELPLELIVRSTTSPPRKDANG